jgi:HK97 family phage prohead protease
MEKKLIEFPLCEIKLDEEGKQGWFKGYASKFGNVDSYGDTIMPGAYTRTLKGRKRSPSMFINHNSYDIPVGDWLSVIEDDKGLLVEGLIDMVHHLGVSLYSAMKRKAMDGMSIGYQLAKGGYEVVEETGGRILKEIILREISVVTWPADDKARISAVKSAIGELVTLADCEAFLSDSGRMSNAAATTFVSHLKTICLSESGIRVNGKGEDKTETVLSLLGQNTNDIIKTLTRKP